MRFLPFLLQAALVVAGLLLYDLFRSPPPGAPSGTESVPAPRSAPATLPRAAEAPEARSSSPDLLASAMRRLGALEQWKASVEESLAATAERREPSPARPAEPPPGRDADAEALARFRVLWLRVARLERDPSLTASIEEELTRQGLDLRAGERLEVTEALLAYREAVGRALQGAPVRDGEIASRSARLADARTALEGRLGECVSGAVADRILQGLDRYPGLAPPGAPSGDSTTEPSPTGSR